MTTPANKGFDFSEEGLRTVMEAMASSFEQRAQQENAEAIEAALEANPKLPRPSDFYLKNVYKQSSETAEVIRALVTREGVTSSEAYRVIGVYKNYSFLKSNLSSLMRDVEGAACSVDKTHTILSLFIRHELEVRKGGKGASHVEYAVKDGHSYAYPKDGTMDAWMEFVDGLLMLQSGFHEPFIEAREAVKSLY